MYWFLACYLKTDYNSLFPNNDNVRASHKAEIRAVAMVNIWRFVTGTETLVHFVYIRPIESFIFLLYRSYRRTHFCYLFRSLNSSPFLLSFVYVYQCIRMDSIHVVTWMRGSIFCEIINNGFLWGLLSSRFNKIQNKYLHESNTVCSARFIPHVHFTSSRGLQKSR